MRYLFLILLFFMACRSNAEEQWFCVDDQSKKNGNTMEVCGVGTASTEGEARHQALQNSIKDFQTICNLSQDCKGRKINIEPKRSTCLKNPSQFHTPFANFTCHRMLLFTIN